METKKLSKKAALLSGAKFSIEGEELLEYRIESNPKDGSVFLLKRYVYEGETYKVFSWSLLGIAKVSGSGITVRSWQDGFLMQGTIKQKTITIK